jgi:hypothetical protein
MYKRIELFVLLFVVVQIIHFTAVLSALSMVVILGKSTFWINFIEQSALTFFNPLTISINDSSELYYGVYIDPLINFVLIVSLILVFLCFVFAYTKSFFFIFRVVSFKKYTISKTGLFLDELGFIITWLSICAVYNNIFGVMDDIMFSKTIIYNSLHAVILMFMFKTKAYGIGIKLRNRPLKM